MKLSLLMDKEQERISISKPNTPLEVNLSEAAVSFLFHSIIMTQSQFSNFVNGVTISEETEYMSNEQVEKARDYLISFSKEIIELGKSDQTIENFACLKYSLDSFFLNVTRKGRLNYNYKEEYLLRSSHVAQNLQISKPTLLATYVPRGLEYIEGKGQKKIPKHVLFYWSSATWSTKIQLLFQQYNQRENTIEKQYSKVMSDIRAFESKYGKQFNEVFSHVLSGEVDEDSLENADDFFEWSDLLEEAHEYEEYFNG